MGMSFTDIIVYAKTQGNHTFTISEGSGSERVMKLSGASRTYSHTAEPRFVKKAENGGGGGGGVAFGGKRTEDDGHIVYVDFGEAIAFNGTPEAGCDAVVYNKIKQWFLDVAEKIKKGTPVTFYYAEDSSETVDVSLGVYSISTLQAVVPDEYTLIDGSYDYSAIFSIATTGSVTIGPYNGHVVLADFE